MTKIEYINSLISAFNKCKEIIMEGEREIIIDDSPHKEIEFVIPEFENFKEITIYSISKGEWLSGKYIHLSGVNILYFISCLYLRLRDNNQGNHQEYTSPEKFRKMNERIKVLKKSSFIFGEDENGFWYYPIYDLQNTGIFTFDLPVITDLPSIKGRK